MSRKAKNLLPAGPLNGVQLQIGNFGRSSKETISAQPSSDILLCNSVFKHSSRHDCNLNRVHTCHLCAPNNEILSARRGFNALKGVGLVTNASFHTQPQCVGNENAVYATYQLAACLLLTQRLRLNLWRRFRRRPGNRRVADQGGCPHRQPVTCYKLSRFTVLFAVSKRRNVAFTTFGYLSRPPLPFQRI